jgi:hypothetical protein
VGPREGARRRGGNASSNARQLRRRLRILAAVSGANIQGTPPCSLFDKAPHTNAGAAKELEAVAEKFSGLELLRPSEVPLPPNFATPFEALGKPLDAYLCEGNNVGGDDDCGYVSVHRNSIGQHCNKVH